MRATLACDERLDATMAASAAEVNRILKDSPGRERCEQRRYREQIGGLGAANVASCMLSFFSAAS
jgi:hypothetical protein